MKSAVEEILKQFNSSYFLREFTFPGKKIKKPGGEDELSDGIIWFDKEMILFQIKERGKLEKAPTEKAQRRWFFDEVRKVGTRQIRESLALFNSRRKESFKNLRGQSLVINLALVSSIHKVVIYHSSFPMPRECSGEKHHISRSTGKSIFIHIINAVDWQKICSKLYTPAEILEYLDFREKYLQSILDAKWKTEEWLIGRFLASPNVPDWNFDTRLDNYEEWFRLLEHNDEKNEKFDEIVNTFYDRIPSRHKSQTKFTKILVELAKLNRKEREDFIARVGEHLKEAYRGHMAVSRTIYTYKDERVGFAFGGAPRDNPYGSRREYMGFLIELCKYDLKVRKCIGVCAIAISPDVFELDWGFDEYTWEKDEEMEKTIQLAYKKGTLRPLKGYITNRYTFRDEAER